MMRRFKMESAVNISPGNKLLFVFDGDKVQAFRHGREIDVTTDLNADEIVRLAEERGYYNRVVEAGRAA